MAQGRDTWPQWHMGLMPSDMGYRQGATSSPCPNLRDTPKVASWDTGGLFLFSLTRGPWGPPICLLSRGPCR